MIEAPKARYFVTGAAGFIGSHLVERLLSEGHTVTGYDNLSLGRREWISPSLRNPNFTFVKADLLDLEVLTESLRGHDIVFHLAANTDIPRGNQDPRMDFDNCIVGTFHMLEAMRACEVQDLLFASSSTVFGEPEVRPTPETIGPPLPISLYGAGKLAGEGLISAYCHLYGIRAWIFRFGNVVGARMGHGVIYDFITKLQKNPEELDILGDGNQEKNYFLVEDCLDGMVFAFLNARERSCDVFNLGTETTTSTTEIARIVVDEMSLQNVPFRYSGGRQGWPGDVPVVKYDLTKMKLLGWRARYTSTEAVRIATRRLLGIGEPV
ncbi:MAG TPA: NAD-dependent epimerase/dehydratase family protein [bacterium]|nr:NAD-dependent epimerase/dehydratase family protein [bacterium]